MKEMFKEVPYDTNLFDDVLKTKDVNERATKIINSDDPMIFSKAYSWVPDDYDFARRQTNERRTKNPSNADREIRVCIRRDGK